MEITIKHASFANIIEGIYTYFVYWTNGKNEYRTKVTDLEYKGKSVASITSHQKAYICNNNKKRWSDHRVRVGKTRNDKSEVEKVIKDAFPSLKMVSDYYETAAYAELIEKNITEENEQIKKWMEMHEYTNWFKAKQRLTECKGMYEKYAREYGTFEAFESSLYELELI